MGWGGGALKDFRVFVEHPYHLPHPPPLASHPSRFYPMEQQGQIDSNGRKIEAVVHISSVGIIQCVGGCVCGCDACLLLGHLIFHEISCC